MLMAWIPSAPSSSLPLYCIIDTYDIADVKKSKPCFHFILDCQKKTTQSVGSFALKGLEVPAQKQKKDDLADGCGLLYQLEYVGKTIPVNLPISTRTDLLIIKNKEIDRTMPLMVSAHHYAFDAIALLDDCIDRLQLTIENDVRGKYDAIYDLKEVLVATERLLHEYLIDVLEKEKSSLRAGFTTSTSSTGRINLQETRSLSSTVQSLKNVLEEKRRQKEVEARRVHFRNPQESPVSHEQHCYYPTRSAADTLLFRLIVHLQLCLVRIEVAYSVIAGRHIRETHDKHGVQVPLVLASCVAGVGVAMVTLSRNQREWRLPPRNFECLTATSVKVGAAMIATYWIRKSWRVWWMADKIVRSTAKIEEWHQQWRVIESTSSSSSTEEESPELLDAKSRRLVEYAMREAPKSSFWQSQGEMRFLMLKRAMDVFYASVGTAMESIDEQHTSSWQLPLVTAAAASFYSLTGASKKASQAVNSSSRDLIRHAWGMVSLPAIKNLMLQASRLLKGAAVADRVEIDGVSCFILSRDPAPELVAALKRQQRRKTTIIPRLSTINESTESIPQHTNLPKKFAGTGGRYRQRDVIFHLTGGGFFAHTIASDLPYLLDWSGSSGAVVICPEYALLPEHTFPVALDQITDVYCSLINGDAVSQLGFEVSKIVVTGESAGGNLAAALCVKLGMCQLDLEDEFEELQPPSDSIVFHENYATRLPDAIMLSCAALNLSLELSLSRVLGTQDPVLPSALISAISDAYLPPEQGVSKQTPLASPFFASDRVLRLFPPTLLFAGSSDPLLDDSVDFNERLRCLGVKSELRAAQNMPHAYWGLGTAGFPEAQQVQQECQEWLAKQFTAP